MAVQAACFAVSSGRAARHRAALSRPPAVAVLFLPFLVIDLVVASVTLSVGMMQLPPVMVSAPFKILLFVLVDGWNLVVGSLVRSFY